MDVVAHARPVGGVVVVAEHLQSRALADRHLADVRHQVVGRAPRVFADQPAFMCAHRVEVAQQCDAPTGVGPLDIAQDVLAHQLGGAVGAGGGERGIFRDRQLLRRAVHRGAGTEHQCLAAELRHGADHAEQAAEVVAVVVEWLGSAFPHGLERCEMHDRRDRMALEKRRHGGAVAHIGAFERDRSTPASQPLQAVEHLRRTVGKIIDADDIETRRPQCEPGVRCDVAGGSGEQDRAAHCSLICAEQDTVLAP